MIRENMPQTTNRPEILYRTEKETDRQVGGDKWRVKSRGCTVVKVVFLTVKYVGYKVIFY